VKRNRGEPGDPVAILMPKMGLLNLHRLFAKPGLPSG
jgi:hypothetical protein